MRFIYTKIFAIFSLCVVTVFILALMQIKGWLDPVKYVFLQAPRPVIYVVEHITVPTKNFLSTIYNLRQIVSENSKLSNQVLELQQQLSELQQEHRDNQALRKELGFAENSKFKLIPCTVLSQNPFSLSDFLTVSCGRDAGVSEGDAVVSQGYLVGKVVYTSKLSSTMLLVTSSQFSSDAKLSKLGSDGVVRGTLGSGIILDQLPQNIQINRGDLVVTAGINEKIPKGLLVGTAGDELSSQSELFKRVTLLSPIDFNNLAFVFAVGQ